MLLPNIHMVTQLWGQHYIDLYTDFVIPTLLSPRNFPVFRDATSVEYEIYTRSEDEARLASHQNFKVLCEALKGWANIKVNIIEGPIADPYATMSACHRKAIEKADDNNAALLFLQPDVLTGDGALETVKSQLLSQKRLVLAPGFRGAREDITALIAKNHEDTFKSEGISSDKLIKYAVPYMHHISKSLVWGDEQINSYCSHLYWHIDAHNLYARCAHMHPLMVYPKNKKCGFDHTIDWDYFYRAVPDKEDWFVANSSDQVCLIELSDRDKFAGDIVQVPATYKTLAHFFVQAAQPEHIHLVQRPFFFQSKELQDQDWQNYDQEASTLIASALKEMKRPLIAKLIRDPGYAIPLLVKSMRYINDRLGHFRQKQPIIGSGAYFIYRSCFLIVREIYRTAGRLKRLAKI
ncbi:MAG: hypothetical protein AAF228_06380 [Pseudomonadota bacterium]